MPCPTAGPAAQPLPEGASAPARGEDASALDVSYLQYLWEAHANILGCVRDCRAWSARYDGDSPDPDAWLRSLSGESANSAADPVFGLPQQLPWKPGPPSAPGKKSQTELEWDDSYDAGISSGAGAGEPRDDADSSGLPAPIDLPRHIQEMKKNAILLFKGSYIEESDFQDDVMVYRLCAEKDSDDTRSSREDPVRPLTQTQTEVQSPPPNNGPLLGPQPETDSEGEHSRDSSDLFENTRKGPKQESEADVAPGSNPESAAPTAEAERRSGPTVVNPGAEDFVAQYDEIIKELDSGPEGLLGRNCSPPDTLLFTKEPVGKEEESRGDKEDEEEGEKGPDDEDEEDDFDAFITETPAEETAPSPFGVRAETAFAGHVPGRTQSTPFTGDNLQLHSDFCF